MTPVTQPGCRVIVLCDFDGTITPVDTSNVLYTRFAAAGTRFADMWERGEISTPEELSLTFATIRASRADMEATLRTIPIDPGFPAFLRYCHEAGCAFAVVSEALVWSIRVILANHGVQDLPIYANVIHFTADGFRFEHPWASRENPQLGTSKPAIIRNYQEAGWQVRFIGDGRSDFLAARQADRVYAKPALAAFCCENGIEHTAFEDFAALLELFKKEG